MLKEKPTAISLFCGAGGCSLGFKMAGYNIVYASDKNKEAVETYKKNFPDTLVECESIEKINFQSIMKKLKLERGDLDILIGGPPCQGFTSAGSRLLDDPRNHLLNSYVTALDTLMPKWFLMENVEGLLTMDKGNIIADIVSCFINLGYFVRLEKIYSQEYGVPQRRKRVVIVGNRIGVNFEFPKSKNPIGGSIFRISENNLMDAIGGLPNASTDEKPVAYDKEVNNNMEGFYRENCFSVSDHFYKKPVGMQMERIFSLKEGETMKDLPESLQHESFKKRANRRVSDGTPSERRGGSPSGLKRLCANEPSLTITSASTREFIHPKENRALTIRECARIQTFPDNFVFHGNASDKVQQIGNAIPPLLAKTIALHILNNFGFHSCRVDLNENRNGKLLGFSLTKASAMSPVLKKTHSLLNLFL